MWIAIALGAAICLGAIATSQGERINSIWLVLASVCSYLIAYRFYGAFIAAKVMALSETRATPAERMCSTIGRTRSTRRGKRSSRRIVT